MITYRNNDERYGDAGPFEAESLDAVIDGMLPAFQAWADDEWNRHVDAAEETDSDPGDCDQFRAAAIERMRDECLEGLEIISSVEVPSCE